MPRSGTDINGTNKSQLRHQLRARRRELSPRQQQQAANAFCKVLKRQPVFRRAKRIAFYCANDGELQLRECMHWCLGQGKHCFLPVLKSRAQLELLFLPVTKHTRYELNRYRIPEPCVPWHKALANWQLDIVLLPLVGFDRKGGRLGMGGGYYDRTFTHLRQHPRRPLLVGVGHQCQEVEMLPMDSWDIALDAIATDTGFTYVHSRHRYKFNA